MKRELIALLFIIIPVGLAAFSGWRLMVNSQMVYKNLDGIWDRAKATKDKVQLHLLYEELRQFHKSHCFIRQYGDYSRQVAAYIRGKLAAL